MSRIKHCFVPICTNNTANAPGKLFLTVPKDETRRWFWCEAVGLPYTRGHNLYCCENHFKLDEDAGNWMFFKTVGHRIKLKENVIPHLNIMKDEKIQLEQQITSSAKKRKSNVHQKFSEPSPHIAKRLFSKEVASTSPYSEEPSLLSKTFVKPVSSSSTSDFPQDSDYSCTMSIALNSSSNNRSNSSLRIQPTIPLILRRSRCLRKNTTTELKRDPEPAKQPYVPVNMVLLPETTDRSQQFTSTSSSFTTPDPLTSVEEPSRRSDISQDKNLPPKPTLNNLTFMNIKSKQSKAFDKSKPSEDCEERIYCRLCLKPTNKNSSTALWVDDVNYPEKNDALKKKQSDKVQEILKMLQFCLPFFDLLTFNPIICCICLERLRISYKFMDECLKNQRLIEHYADTRGSSTEKIVNIAEMIETKFTLSNTERKIPAHIPDNSINNATKRSSQQIKTEKYSDEDNTASKKQKICHELQNDDSLTVSNIETANVKIEPDTDAFSALTELLTRDIPRGEIESGNIDEETIIKIEPNYIDCPDFIKTELEDDLHIKNELFNKRTGIGTDIGQEGQRSHFDETGNDPLHKANISFFRREPIFLNIDSNIETITSDVIK